MKGAWNRWVTGCLLVAFADSLGDMKQEVNCSMYVSNADRAELNRYAGKADLKLGVEKS